MRSPCLRNARLSFVYCMNNPLHPNNVPARYAQCAQCDYVRFTCIPAPICRVSMHGSSYNPVSLGAATATTLHDHNSVPRAFSCSREWFLHDHVEGHNRAARALSADVAAFVLHATMSHPPTATLPLELFDKVIDELRGDHSTLLACALVHRSLYPHAEAVLYRTIRIESQRSYDLLVRIGLQQEGRRLLSLVQELELVALDQEETAHGGLDPEVLSRFLFVFAGISLPNLYYLNLVNLRVAMGALWNNVLPNPFGRMYKTFATVTDLRLQGVQFVKLRDFARFICSLSRLDTLILYDVGIRHLNTPFLMTPATGDHLKLRVLFIHSSGDTAEGQAICEWLAHTPLVTSRTLHTLTMEVGRGSRLEGNQRRGEATLLERLGESVHVLKLGIPASRTYSPRECPYWIYCI